MIILISGSINTGKSTVSKLLAEKLVNTALVEIDSLRAFIDWMPIDRSVPLNLENAVSVIRTFAQHGLHVIVPYPLSRKNHEYLVGSLPEYEHEIRTYTLGLPLEIALLDRGDRKLTDWEWKQIEHRYIIGIMSPQFGMIIDTEGKSAEQVANIIFADLGESIEPPDPE